VVRRLFPIPAAAGLPASLRFYCEFHLQAAGVPVVLEPAEQPWGERIAYVEHCMATWSC
jgi:uncharacterized glyoxalase superfamily protein PhnB